MENDYTSRIHTNQNHDFILVQALKECKRNNDLNRGRKLHKEVINCGGKLNSFVASSLVSMYATCNCLVDARSIFDGMNFRDVVCWNSMIFGYVQNGEGEKAFQLFLDMQRSPSPRPNLLTFIGAINACSILAENEVGRQTGDKKIKIQALRQGKRVHFQALNELQLNKNLNLGREYTFLSSSIVDMYSKCGSMKDAQAVFDSVPDHLVDEVLLTALSLGYAENLDGRSSLAIFIRITRRKHFPGKITYVAAFKACSSLAEQESKRKMKYLEVGMAIHRLDANTTGYCVRDTVVGNVLIDMYSICGSVSDAERVFHAMQRRDVVSWNTMIKGYSLNEKNWQALHLYTLMRAQGLQLFQIDALSIIPALKACSSLAEEKDNNTQVQGPKMICLEIGMALHSQAVSAGCESNSFIVSSLLDMYSKCGSLVDVRLVFHKVMTPNMVTWNILLTAFVDNSEEDEALQFFHIMMSTGCVPDSRTYVAALRACAALAEKEEGKSFINDRQRPIMKLLSLERGMAIHRELMITAAACCDSYVESSLVDMYSKCGAVNEAYRVFKTRKTRDTVAWTSFLLGQVGNDENEEALRLFVEECEDKSNVWILLAAVKACGNAISPETGKGLHSQLCRHGFEHMPAVVTCLIDFYGKIGNFPTALLLFHSAILCEEKDVLTWAALINGYNREGDFHGAVRCFYAMLDEGLLPNTVMFMEILTVCSHAGFVNHGKFLFKAMQTFGVHQGPEHFQCIVDLLTRANNQEEAIDFLEKTPFRATIVNWMTILGSCYKWKNVRAARRAFQEVMILSATENS